MQLLDGKVVSQHIKSEIKKEVEEIIATGKRAPHLVAILVGENPASKAYVGSKVKTCAELGFALRRVSASGLCGFIEQRILFVEC